MAGQVSYYHPTIGPRYYMARGTSGWAETFPRTIADAELTKLLGTVTLAIAVEGFRNQRKLTKGAIEWATIIDYLAFICRCKHTLVTDLCGVAFWCQVILAERAASEAKAN